MSNESKRIIISRTDRIGDVVLALPVFASLRKCYPESELDALVSAYAADVVSSFHDVDGVIIYDPADSFLKIVEKLRRADAGTILFLFPRFRLAAAAFIAAIPVRVGTAYRWYSFLFNRKVREHRKESVRSEAEYNLSLARAIGCESAEPDVRLNIDTEALETAKEFLSRNGIGRFIAVHPGSGGSACDWSAVNFRRLCAEASAKLDVAVVVTGSSSESGLCDMVAAGSPGCVNAAGAFSLREFIALLSLADVFISNSTGPIHLAAAVGTAVVGIYPNNKPMTPVRWAPLTDRKSILTPNDGTDDLTRVRVEEVLDSVAAFLPVKSR